MHLTNQFPCILLGVYRVFDVFGGNGLWVWWTWGDRNAKCDQPISVVEMGTVWVTYNGAFMCSLRFCEKLWCFCGSRYCHQSTESLTPNEPSMIVSLRIVNQPGVLASLVLTAILAGCFFEDCSPTSILHIATQRSIAGHPVRSCLSRYREMGWNC